MQFYEINICQAMMFRLYTVYKKHEKNKKLAIKLEKNRKYYSKYSNNFAAYITCSCRVKPDCLLVGSGTIGGMPSLGVFLREPDPYLREFRLKSRKTLNG